VVRWSFS